jgi:hypothetical protein
MVYGYKEDRFYATDFSNGSCQNIMVFTEELNLSFGNEFYNQHKCDDFVSAFI